MTTQNLKVILKQVIKELKDKENTMSIVDFSNISSFTPWKSGTYRFRVLSWESGQSSKKGTPQIRFECEEVVSGNGYIEYINITDKSAWKVGSFIVNCGINIGIKIDTGTALFGKLCDACVGRELYITLEEDKAYNNNKSVGYARVPEEEQATILFKGPTEDVPNFVKDEVQWKD